MLISYLLFFQGIDGYRKSVMKGRKLPHPRLVTRMVHADFDHPSTDMTILVMSWGQFLDHDLALAMPPRCKCFFYTCFRYIELIFFWFWISFH